MAKKKLKIVPVREANGRLSRASRLVTEACTPGQAKRLRDAALLGMAAPEWATEIGRLFLARRLTPEQYEAGKRWGRLASATRKALAAPKPVAKAASLFGGGSIREPDPDSDEGLELAKSERKILADMDAAKAALGEGAPAAAVRACCEENEVPVGSLGIHNLLAGLDALAEHWGLT
ncbi:hypothetical protein [Faunimonas pinastri]|uniref:hypothetical protein n=1 Tax=Faunimonas pinastri TaxID=1855383 RepID=UPI00115FE8E3|nr:hypothetical protein [Faunimonas pinastri]